MVRVNKKKYLLLGTFLVFSFYQHDIMAAQQKVAANISFASPGIVSVSNPVSAPVVDEIIDETSYLKNILSDITVFGSPLQSYQITAQWTPSFISIKSFIANKENLENLKFSANEEIQEIQNRISTLNNKNHNLDITVIYL